MNWLVRTFVGAVIAGAGWKIGVEVYERVKKQFEPKEESKEEENAENGAAATQTDVVDVSENPKTRLTR